MKPRVIRAPVRVRSRGHGETRAALVAGRVAVGVHRDREEAEARPQGQESDRADARRRRAQGLGHRNDQHGGGSGACGHGQRVDGGHEGRAVREVHADERGHGHVADGQPGHPRHGAGQQHPGGRDAAEQQPGRQHHEGEQDGFFQPQLPGEPGRGSAGHREAQRGDRGEQRCDQRAVAQDSLQVVEKRGGAGDAGTQVEPDEHERHDAGHDHAPRADRAGWSCLGKCGNRRAASHS